MRFVPKKKPAQRRTPASRSVLPTTNYYRSGSKANSRPSPFEKKVLKVPKARKFLVRGVDIVLILALLTGLVYTMLVKSNPKVVINTQAYHATSVYQQAAAKAFSGVKNSNKLSLDEQGIVKSLQKEFPEIDSASIELPLFTATPVVHINISAPQLVLQNQAGSYVIDGQGRTVSLAADLPASASLPKVIDQSGFVAAPGKQALSAAAVSFITNLLAQSAKAKVPIASLTLPSAAEEGDLRTVDHPYYTKFFLSGDALSQIGQFLAARHQFDTAGSQPSEYLDVRVPGKIFYK